jgi:hypothetical protein
MFRRIRRPIIQLQVVDPQLAEIGIAHIGSPDRCRRTGERQDYWVTFTAELWAGTSPGFRSAHPKERLLEASSINFSAMGPPYLRPRTVYVRTLCLSIWNGSRCRAAWPSLAGLSIRKQASTFAAIPSVTLMDDIVTAILARSSPYTSRHVTVDALSHGKNGTLPGRHSTSISALV